jgi:hypothetical protein
VGAQLGPYDTLLMALANGYVVRGQIRKYGVELVHDATMPKKRYGACSLLICPLPLLLSACYRAVV